ncbi:MAG: PQQ-binding-like beta-propeller repeat protein [Candidatus Bathyarchaeota archaeon]|nr:PQQ-binding-like beta-propeller repeat protein [Candidatus Bathyarchaeota archaeon]
MFKKSDDSKKLRMSVSVFAVAFALLLIFSTFAAMPSAVAHTPAWEIPTYAYISVSPNPVGVNQQMFVVMWLDKVLPGALIDNDLRFYDYQLTITKPDGTTETQTFPVVSDTTSSQFALFTPTEVGTYTFKFEYPGQTFTWEGDYQNDTYLPSSAETTLTVQQDQVLSAPNYPLPTSYWTRPIEGQNTGWECIASNYLNPNGAEFGSFANRFQPDGLAPGSAHVMWAQPLQDGGVVGGSNVGVSGATYYTGLSYEGRFTSPIIMQGRLYYSTPLSNSVAGGFNDVLGGEYVCVDLQTGETIWSQNYAVNPTFGQLYDYESPNQHGVIPYLWAVSGTTWIAYEPSTGKWLYNLTNVPSGKNVYGPNGEILRYVFDNDNNWLACWNNTAAFYNGTSKTVPGQVAEVTGAGIYYWRPVGKVIDASTAYSWNVTIPQLPAGSSIAAVVDDVVLGNTPTSTPGQRWGTVDTYTFWALSLKPETRGQLLWEKDYTAPEGNLTRQVYAVDPTTRTFLLNDKETMQWLAYSIDDGSLLWGPVGDTRDFNYYGTVGMGSAGQAGFAAYGNLYTAGYGGELFCYDIETGNLVWKYNNTYSGTENAWGMYPLFIGAIADGKVYCYTGEHSPNAPQSKGSLVRCIDAYTGDELWTLMSWAAIGSFGAEGFPVADGYMAYLNTYDMQVYCIGKGPSATTVAAPQPIISEGSSILLTGMVTDECAGAKALVQSGKFTAVPAMSDASMGEWMQYLYMQKPKPSDAIGVTVHLTAIDPNGNFQDIGTTVADINGKYGITWTPPVSGTYHVTATFEGSDSYWSSQDTTYFVVDPAAAAQPTSPSPSAPNQTASPSASSSTPAQSVSPSPSEAPQPTSAGTPTMTYIAIAAAVVIIAVVLAAVALRRRK